jgi:lactoylglutathione lyase
MALFKSIGHVAFNVRDMDAALAFYVGKLGFAEMFRMHHDTGELAFVYLRITDTQYLELFPASGEAPPPDRQYAHFCLEVNDLDTALAEMEKRGVNVVVPKRQGKSGCWLAFIADPEGNRIELMEMPADGMHLRAIEQLRSDLGF